MKKPTNPYLVPDDQFNGYLDHAIGFIESVVERGDCTDFIPTLQVYGMTKGDDERVLHHCVLTDFDMDKRYELLRMLGARFAQDGILAVCVIFLTEAWQSIASQEQLKRVMPRDDPKRLEIVQAAGLTYDLRSAMGRVVVTRDKQNNMVMGEKEIYHYGGDVAMENIICKSFFRGQADVLVEKRKA